MKHILLLLSITTLMLLFFCAPACKQEEAPTVWQTAQFDLRVQKNLVYGQGLTHSDWNSESSQPIDLFLDLYEPMNAGGKRPVVVLIHGGGFTGGDKTTSQMTTFAQYFGQRGFTCISINYRLAGDHGTVPVDWLNFANALDVAEDQKDQVRAMYPAGRDAKAAVRWLTSKASELNLATSYISVIGGSAGSYLTMMLGVTEASDFRDELTATDDPTLASTNVASSSRVRTLIDHWGGTALVDALDMIWQRQRWDALDAPVSIVHGTEDQTVPFDEAIKIRDHYQANGVPYAFYPLEGQGHSAWDATVEGKTLPELAFDFIVAQQGLVVSQ